MNSTAFNNSGTQKLNGFFIYPDGRSKRFSFGVGSDGTIDVPWSKRIIYLYSVVPLMQEKK